MRMPQSSERKTSTMAYEAQPVPHLNLISSVLSPTRVAEPPQAVPGLADGATQGSPDLAAIVHPGLADSSSATALVPLYSLRLGSDTPSAPSCLSHLAWPIERSPAASDDASTLRTRLVLVDVAAVLVSWLGLASLTSHLPSRTATHLPAAIVQLGPAAVAAVVMLVAMRLLRLYCSRRCVRPVDVLWRLSVAGACGAAGFAAAESILGTTGTNGIVCAAASVAVVGLGRWEFAQYVRSQRAQGRHLRRVVLVGGADDALAMHTMLVSEPELGYAVAAVAGPAARQVTANVPAASDVSDIARLAALTGATGILVVPYGLSAAELQAAIGAARAARLHVQVWAGLPGIGSRRLRSVPLSGEPFFYVEPCVPAAWQVAVKRVIDIAGATVALSLFAPAIGVAALLIKLEDRGPIFHRSERIGKDGRPFLAVKLRSMVVEPVLSADELSALNERTDGPLFKAAHDPRVTKVGWILRSSSLDELPQLWNVLRGTMSLVGPRPALPEEVAQFDGELQRRHSVRPGMTGMWQVEARRNPSFHAYRRLDLRYVDNWSLSLDLSILAATLPAVIGQALNELRRRRAG